MINGVPMPLRIGIHTELINNFLFRFFDAQFHALISQQFLPRQKCILAQVHLHQKWFNFPGS